MWKYKYLTFGFSSDIATVFVRRVFNKTDQANVAFSAAFDPVFSANGNVPGTAVTN